MHSVSKTKLMQIGDRYVKKKGRRALEFIIHLRKNVTGAPTKREKHNENAGLR